MNDSINTKAGPGSRIDVIGQNGNDGEHYGATMEDLLDAVYFWAVDREILYQSTVENQIEKLKEELVEFEVDVVSQRYDDAEVELGDMMVVLTILAALLHSSPEECLRRAFEKIKHRKGKMVNGLFVKEEDLERPDSVELRRAEIHKEN